MIWTLFRTVAGAAWNDVLRPRRVAAWAGVAVVVGLIGSVWSNLATHLSPIESAGQLAQVVVYRLMALAAAVFATFVIAQEVEQRTMPFLLMRPVPRWTLALGRMTAAWGATVAVTWLAAVAGAVGVLGVKAFGQPAFWRDLPLLALGAAAYVGAFTALSLFVRKSLVVSLLFAFGWESFVPNMPGDMYALSVMTYVRSLSPYPEPKTDPNLLDALAGSLATRTAGPNTAWTVLIVLSLAAWALTVWWFGRAEFVPKEDPD